MDLSHLDALNVRRSHERGYLAAAKTDRERQFRQVQIASVEKEIAGEYRYLGIDPVAECNLSDGELLAELMA